MSINLITGSLSGNTQTGSWGIIFPLTDSDIYISGALGETRFTLPKGQTFGTTALNGSSPFPNDIALITVYGQGEVLAYTTTPTAGGGGSGGATGIQVTGSFVQLLSGSVVISSAQIYPAPTASYALTASYLSGSVPTASLALTASYIDVTGSGVLVNWNGSTLQLTGSVEIDTGSLLYTSSLIAGPGIVINQTGSKYIISSSVSQSNYFDLIELGKNTNPLPSSSGNWRMITSASNLNFEYWDGSQWILDTYFDGTPFSGSGTSGSIINTGSFVTTSSFNNFTASYIIDSASFSSSIANLNNFSSSYTTNSASFSSSIANILNGTTPVLTSSFSVTASYVSGAVLNYPDPYISVPVATNIVTLTNAEYTAIVTKNPNTIYVIVG